MSHLKHSCNVCGYQYDDAAHDTPFDCLPSDWYCPLCGVDKAQFSPMDDNAVQAQQSTNHIVVIGAGLAGFAVVDALRSANLPVTLISSDDADRYHKPMLSTAISQHKTPADLVRMTGEQAAQAGGFTLLSNTTVTHIDTANKTLTSSAGDIHYTHLVLAIGAQPIIPEALRSVRSHQVNHLADFTKLQNALDKPKRIGIIGGGMVGCELAEDLVRAGHQVSLIDRHTTPLSSLLPSQAGARLLDALTGIGVLFIGEADILSASGEASITLHILQNDRQSTHDFDEIIIATGLVVDETLPASAHLAMDKSGIIVNPTTLQTSTPDIYALGDCISIDGAPCRYVMPHRAQAAAISAQILGNDAPYTHKPPMIRLKNKSISIQATGTPAAVGDWQVQSDTDDTLILEKYHDGAHIATLTVKS